MIDVPCLAEELDLIHHTSPDTIKVDASYQGPRIELPINKEHLESLILAFQRKEVKLNFSRCLIWISS